MFIIIISAILEVNEGPNEFYVIINLLELCL